MLHVLERCSDGSPGVSKTIRTAGDGEKPKMGDKVRIKYSAMLDDGTMFASSSTVRNKTGEIEITLGMREMYGTGGDLGLVSMRVGERAMITASPEFSYGEEGVGKAIPPNARLTFDATLIAIIDPASAMYKELRRGLVMGALVIGFVLFIAFYGPRH